MAKYTENYNLEKPDKTEHYDIETANKNNDIIDARLFAKQDKQAGKGLSTNDFTNEYKKKIDALQRIYKYCGSVEAVADLDTIEERQIGDVYNVKDTNIDYCWNGTEWTELGNAVDLTNYQTTEQANQDKQKIKDNLVVVSPTEPIGDKREKVWIQKGKNLFDKSSGIISGSFIGSDGNIGIDTNLFYQTVYIPTTPNTRYTISSNTGENHRIAEYDNNKTFIKRNLNDGGGSVYAFTTSSNCYFVRISCNISNLDNIQLEQGFAATEYEEYIEPKIYVKNDNDVYEEFVKQERETGWIQLNESYAIYYRKVNRNVEINFYIYSSEGVTFSGYTETVIGNLPIGFRPSKTVYMPVFVRTLAGSYTPHFRVIVKTTGDLILHNWGGEQNVETIDTFINYTTD